MIEELGFGVGLMMRYWIGIRIRDYIRIWFLLLLPPEIEYTRGQKLVTKGKICSFQNAIESWIFNIPILFLRFFFVYLLDW